ncbi:MAG: hypothetical protein WD577_12200 [Bacteroidales bacterium]
MVITNYTNTKIRLIYNTSIIVPKILPILPMRLLFTVFITFVVLVVEAFRRRFRERNSWKGREIKFT